MAKAKRIINLILIAALVLSSRGSNAYAKEQDHEAFKLDLPAAQAEVDSIEVETLTVDSIEEAAEKVSEILLVETNENSTTKTVVSSAYGKVLESAARTAKQVALLPVTAKRVLSTVGENVSNAAKIDKLGLAITTYRLGNDVIRWIHTDDMSTFAKTTGVLYLFLTATLTGVDKESWPKVLRPIEKKWTKILKYSPIASERTKSQKTILSYLSNATGVTLINVGFVPILAYDRIASGDAASLMTSLFMGLITTASAFSWFEFFRAIDQKLNPRAKEISRLLLNSRTIAISSVASTVTLLNYQSYGAAPWIWLSVSGMIGLPLMLKADKIANWLEKSPLINRAAKLYGRVSQAVRFKKAESTNRSEIRVCRDLFAVNR